MDSSNRDSDALILERATAALSRRYAVRRRIGSGGMATVLLAEDMRHQRDVAIKVLRPELATAVGAERFLREIRTAARLAHPNILPVFDSGEINGLLYFVMPFVPGETLRQRLDREGQLPLEDALDIAREIAGALAYAHAHDVVHRDIKPENVLLYDGHAMVTDFGIARPISGPHSAVPTEEVVTSGTPLYMSPEQPGGRFPVDGRSDIYSLGCVLYEMIAGEPPFTGNTAHAIIARHLSDPPKSLRSRRASVPAWLEAAVTRALAKAPADRFPTATQFAGALQGPGVGAPWRRLPGSLKRWWYAVPAVASLVALGVFAVPQLASGAGLDADLYMILPFTHRANAAPGLTGDQCESLLYEALTRWEDVRVVNALRVNDARARLGGKAPENFTNALQLARDMRAGLLIWGEVWEVSDTVHVRAALYDVKHRGRTIREQYLQLPRDRAKLGQEFQQLAAALLRDVPDGVPVADAAMGTRFLQAWDAYQEGQVALKRWHLTDAAAGFRQATEEDPEYAQAQLWLAQSLAWSGAAPELWRGPAASALALREHLSPRDRRLAQALLDLGQGRQPQACEQYRALIAIDSLDFRAWLGLGECQARDRVVVPDPRSPSGWRFRGSYHAAVEAYRRALEIVPSFQFAFRGLAYGMLGRMLYAEPNVVRFGQAESIDSLRFAAYPGLDHDTLAFIPYPQLEVLQGVRIPASKPAAVTRNREVMRTLTTAWIQAFPDSAEANEAHARVLETLGLIGGPADPVRSALAAVRRARATAGGSERAVRLGAMEVRLRLKQGDFAAARLLADSLLRAALMPSPAEAAHLAGLAALTGRQADAAALLARSALTDTLVLLDGRPITLPIQVHETALRLLAFASFGASPDSIARAEQELERQIRSYVDPNRRDPARAATLAIPSALAYADRGVGPGHQLAGTEAAYLLKLQQMHAQGDRPGMRRELERIRGVRASIRPGDVSLEATYHESRLRLTLGDTTGVLEQLDLSLTALPALGTAVLTRVPEAAALVRSMALRADLAAAAGDRETARRWAGAVALLWGEADQALQPVVSRMRGLESAR